MILPAITESLFVSAAAGIEVADAPRMRLLRCQLEHQRAAISRVEVEFAGPSPSQRIVRFREGTSCPAGDLRLAALATLDAVEEATNGTVRLELIGAKPLRAFDTNLVVVAAMAHMEHESIRIVGAAIVEGDLLYATSRAALSAVHRLATPLTSEVRSRE